MEYLLRFFRGPAANGENPIPKVSNVPNAPNVPNVGTARPRPTRQPEPLRRDADIVPFSLTVLQVFQDVSAILATKEKDRTLRAFFWHFNFYYLKIRETISRTECSSSGEGIKQLLQAILVKLESLLTRSPTLQPHNNSHRPYPKLDSLQAYWQSPTGQTDKLKVIQGCIEFGNRQSLEDLEWFLIETFDELKELLPEQSEQVAEARASTRRKTPSLEVWNAACALFDALVTAEDCLCHQSTMYAARIGLKTFRSKDDHKDDEFNFDIFYSLGEHSLPWQEAKIKTLLGSEPKTKTRVKIVLPDSKPPSNQRGRRLQVNLCKQFAKRDKPVRLNLVAENGKLWKDNRSDKITARVEPAISLQEVIAAHPNALTEKTKRILAVLLGHGLLHFFSSDWLQASFEDSSIVFPRTQARIPLKPYIQASLQKSPMAQSTTNQADAGAEEFFDPDNHSCHPYPALVAFACILMELYLGRTIEYLIQEYGPDDDYDDENENDKFLGAEAVFKKCKFEFPDKFRTAIDESLNQDIGVDENNEFLDHDALRRVLYERIVQPLEDELEQGFGRLISIEELDSVAQTLDLLNFGQAARRPTKQSAPRARSPDGVSPSSSVVQLDRTDTLYSVSPTAPPTPPTDAPTNASASAPNIRGEFQIAIICALPLEADAVRAAFDSQLDVDIDGKAPGDHNAYSTGVIGRHKVVLVHMPGMGNQSSATVAAKCGSSFPGIKLALVVGICGGVPFPKEGQEILLGDTVVSEAIIPYDFGRQFPGEFMRRTTVLDTVPRPQNEIRNLLAKLKSKQERKILQKKAYSHLLSLKEDLDDAIIYPGAEKDKLYEPSYRHKHQVPSDCSVCASASDDRACETARTSNCEELKCDNQRLVSRKRLQTVQSASVKPENQVYQPMIHFGLVASGSSVMKSGEDRDKIAKKEEVIAFEMEGAGVWDIFPTLVIKGVCDYADSHKSKVWQDYAAATAAAYVKAFLEYWPTNSYGA